MSGSEHDVSLYDDHRKGLDRAGNGHDEGGSGCRPPPGHHLSVTAMTEGTVAVTSPDRDTPIGAVDALLAAGRVIEAVEVVEVALFEGTLSGRAAAQLRLRLSSGLLMNGYAAEALSQAEAVLAESGLEEIYNAAQLSRLLATTDHGKVPVRAE